MRRFEYMKAICCHRDGPLIEEMNKWGAEGWELVSAAPWTAHLGATNQVVLYFKRERADA